MSEALWKLKNRLIPIEYSHVLIGISGGADSTALLMMLLPEIRADRLHLEAIHVNHGLRGAASDEDEAFVRDLCTREGIPITVYHPDLGGKSDENTARTARFGCFAGRMKETGAEALLLAHNADDQAETILLHLLRGAGADGLTGMREESDIHGYRLLRPMLAIRREEIRKALREDGIAWREDATNQDENYLRNRIRRRLIPEMEEISQEAVFRIIHSAQLVTEDNDLLNQEAAHLLEAHSNGELLDAEALKECPYPIKKRVARMWWRRQKASRKERELSAEQTKSLTELVDGKAKKMNLPGGLHAVRGKRYLHLTGAIQTVPAPVFWERPRTVFGPFTLLETPSEGNPGDGTRCQEVPAGFAEGCVIRTRQPGDRITPFGSDGSRKLQDYLTDRHIDEPFRDRIPLLCRGNEVLLAGGIGAGNIPRWQKGADHVRLCWTGPMPWEDKDERQE